jgi:hypothetical protein
MVSYTGSRSGSDVPPNILLEGIVFGMGGLVVTAVVRGPYSEPLFSDSCTGSRPGSEMGPTILMEGIEFGMGGLVVTVVV